MENRGNLTPATLKHINRLSAEFARVNGPILWGHSGPLCHALSLLLSLSWTSMRRRRATVAIPGEWQCKTARSGKCGQHFSNASCYIGGPYQDAKFHPSDKRFRLYAILRMRDFAFLRTKAYTVFFLAIYGCAKYSRSFGQCVSTTCHYSLLRIAKCWSIFKILSPQTHP